MKPTLLLLHGAISSGKQFDKLLPLLNDEFDVYVFTFPGHGGNKIPAEEFSIPLFANALLYYLVENNLMPAYVFGYSMGGYVALYIASRLSNQFQKIITLGTKLNWTEETAAREVVQLNPEKIEEKVPAFAEVLKQLHAPEDWKAVLNKTSEMLMNLGKNPLLNKEAFERIKIPVVIGLGDSDKMVSREESENAVQYLANGKFQMLENTQHPFERVDVNMLSGKLKEFFIK